MFADAFEIIGVMDEFRDFNLNILLPECLIYPLLPLGDPLLYDILQRSTVLVPATIWCRCVNHHIVDAIDQRRGWNLRDFTKRGFDFGLGQAE